jgi:glycosyltransferase involved in cell wall biosynthesis
MKVLMFGWEFPPYHSGGLGTACAGLCRALSAQGHAVTFVLPRQVDVQSESVRLLFADSPPDLAIQPVNALLSPYLDMEAYAQGRVSMESVLYGGDMLDEVRRYAIQAAITTQSSLCDVIHAHDWLSFGAGIEARKVHAVPLIAHVHSTEWDRAGGQALNQRIYDVEREGLHQADGIIAVSHYTREVLVRHYGVSPDAIEVVHNGVDPDAYSASDAALPFQKGDRKVVLFVGRVTLQKGPDYFLKMARKLLEYRSDILFVIVGTGDMEARLREEAAASGISEQFFFAGFLKGETLAAVYRAADLFVLPSVSEPFGISAMESLMHGTPALISRQSGVSEILSHVLKVDFWDIEEMTNKILAVLEHGVLQAELRIQGQQEARQFTWSASAEKCAAIYRRVQRRASVV